MQQSMADMEYGNRKRKTKRDIFLQAMDDMIPWEKIIETVRPHYPPGNRGRPPRGLETMLRMYQLQSWYGLSDKGAEDAVYDSYAFRKFMKVDFVGADQVPDATTLGKFRRMMKDSGIAWQFSDALKGVLSEQGKMMHSGSIIDAALTDLPSSTVKKGKGCAG